MKYSLQILSLTLLLACGSDKNFKSSAGGTYTITSEGTPFIYELDQSDCTFDDLTRNPRIDFYADGIFNKGRINNLKSQSLDHSIMMGGEYEINIGRISTLRTIDTGTPFEYCINKTALKDSSFFQNAALSVLYPLRDFEDKYHSLIRNLDIPKVKIQILPKYTHIKTTKVKRDQVTETKYLINNAMYLGARDTLIFLPQGSYEDSFIPFGGVPLWKSPAVVMHEYAHHLFNHIVIENNRMNNLGDSGLCMDNRDLLSAVASSGNQERLIVSKDDALVAVNEGFADVFAFYASGKKTFFKDMGCMENTRDVESGRFFSQTEKVLSERVVKKFLDTSSDYSLPCSVGENFQDPHMVGAIIAHGVYKTLESTNFTDYYKLKIIIDWARNLKTIYMQSSGPDELINNSVKAFFEMVTKYSSNSIDQCEAAKSVFPNLDLNCP